MGGGLLGSEEGQDLSGPSFAFLFVNFRIKKKRKMKEKEKSLYAGAPVPLFCVFTRVFVSRKKQVKKAKRKEKT
jgi:hypothetical protein